MIESSGLLIIFVASKRPPSPTSNSNKSAGWRENANIAAAVVISKKVIFSPLFAFSHSNKVCSR